MLSSITRTATALALAATGSIALVGVTTGSASATTVATRFAYRAHGFGTFAQGGQVPGGSDQTALQSLACTNKAGLSKTNYVASSPMGGLGHASAIATRVWTSKVGTTYSSHSVNSIASVTLGDATTTGALLIKGISAEARAFHSSTGFHATTASKVLSISLLPPGGLPAAPVDIPSPGQTVTVPGLAAISLGGSIRNATGSQAHARSVALVVRMLASGSTVTLGSASTNIESGVQSALFNGQSYGSKAVALNNNLSSGPAPLNQMPCQGTYGKTNTMSSAGGGIAGKGLLGAITTHQMAAQKGRRAWGFEQAYVASFNLGGGQLIVNGIQGKASASRYFGVLHTSILGTTIGTITANGEPKAFPSTGILEIPGVAKLQRDIVTRDKFGIKVISLRITLLDGSGAVIDLGTARMRILPSGL